MRHHTPHGFRNNYVLSVTKSLGEVLRWQFQRLRAGLPPKPTVPTPCETPDLDFIHRNASPIGMVPAVTWIGHASALDVYKRQLLPWLDRSPVKSIRYRGPIYKVMLAIFVVSFIALAVCGLKPPSGIYPMLARVCTVLYFAFFILMPVYTKFESTKPVPERVTGHD